MFLFNWNFSILKKQKLFMQKYIEFSILIIFHNYFFDRKNNKNTLLIKYFNSFIQSLSEINDSIRFEK